jgi:hypothetical protein
MDDKDSNEKKEFDEEEDEDLNDFYSLHQKKNKANERIATKIRNLLKKDKAFSNLMNINRKMKNNNIMNNYNNKIKEEEKK